MLITDRMVHNERTAQLCRDDMISILVLKRVCNRKEFERVFSGTKLFGRRKQNRIYNSRNISN
jgi:hypothetical protein